MVWIQNRTESIKNRRGLVWFSDSIFKNRLTEPIGIFLTIYLFIINHISLFNVLNSTYAYRFNVQIKNKFNVLYSNYVYIFQIIIS
jgi:hypothetical protein